VHLYYTVVDLSPGTGWHLAEGVALTEHSPPSVDVDPDGMQATMQQVTEVLEHAPASTRPALPQDARSKLGQGETDVWTRSKRLCRQ